MDGGDACYDKIPAAPSGDSDKITVAPTTVNGVVVTGCKAMTPPMPRGSNTSCKFKCACARKMSTECTPGTTTLCGMCKSGSLCTNTGGTGVKTTCRTTKLKNAELSELSTK